MPYCCGFMRSQAFTGVHGRSQAFTAVHRSAVLLIPYQWDFMRIIAAQMYLVLFLILLLLRNPYRDALTGVNGCERL